MIEKAEVAEKIRRIFSKEFGVDGALLKPEARLYQDLGLDSIDAIDMVVRLEMETGLKLSAMELRGLRTLEDVIELVSRRLNENK